jgi:hypothetical protein
MPPTEGIDIKREMDLLWKQGIGVLRDDVKDVKEDVKDLASGMASTRRWLIGLVVVTAPAYAAVIIEFVRK